MKRYVVLKVDKNDMFHAFEKDIKMKRWVELFNENDMMFIRDRLHKQYTQYNYWEDLKHIINDIVSVKQMKENTEGSDDENDEGTPNNT